MAKIKEILTKPITLILLISLAVRLIFFFDYHHIWWDSAVYIGMGKFIFSLGTHGLWEPLRPVIWPILLGLLWKLKLNPLFFGRVLNLLFSLGVIYLTYKISKHIFNKTTAIISSILISFSSIFFFSTFHLYTEISSIFFVLLALHFLLKKQHFLAGIIFGIAFLSKFPMGIYIIPAAIFIIFKEGFKLRKQNIINTIFMGIGFIIPLTPYLIANQLIYNNPLLPFIEGSSVITQVLGCNYFEFHPWYFYFLVIPGDNILNLFAIFGLFVFFKNTTKQKLLIFFFMLLPLIYFIQLNCRAYRYIILFLPFLIMFSGYGLSSLISKLNKKKFLISLLIILIISMSFATTYYLVSEQPKQEPWQHTEFFKYAKDKQTTGEVWISNPIINLYNDKNLKLLYYPRLGEETIPALKRHFSQNTASISYVFMDTCDGGFLCKDEDLKCMQERDSLINTLNSYFNQVFYKKQGECDYYVFENTNQPFES